MANQPVEHETLLAFIDGTLDPEETQALNERMANDEDLRRQVAALMERRAPPSPPPFRYPGDSGAPKEQAPPPTTVEVRETSWQRFVASLKGQTQQQSRLAAFAIGSLIAAACSGLVFLLYLDSQIKATTTEPVPATVGQEAQPPAVPPAEAPPAEPVTTDQAAAPAAGETASPPAAESAPAAAATAEVLSSAASGESPAPQEPAATETAPPPTAEAAAPASPVVTEDPAQAPLGQPAKAGAPAGGRFAVLAKDCPVHKEPLEGSKTVNQLSEGQRLWTEPATDGWKKVYRKKGVAFVPEDCFATDSAKPPAAAKSVKPAGPAQQAKRDDPLRDEAAELSDQPAAPAPSSADRKDKYYMTLLARGETKLDGAGDPAGTLGYLAERLDGNTNCLPTSIPAEKLGDTVTLNVRVKADGTIRAVSLEPKVTGGEKIAACFKSRLAADRIAMSGGNEGRFAIVLRVH